MMLAAFNRFFDCVGTWWTGFDQLAQVTIKTPFHVLGLCSAPSADDTISDVVGRNAILGKKWALVAEKVINFIMQNPEHCREAIARDDND